MALKKVLLDTNIILYSLVSADPKADSIIENNKIFVSEITLIEILGYSGIQKEKLYKIKELDLIKFEL